MIVSSLDLFRHELIGIVLLWLMREMWLQGYELKQFERRWARGVAGQQRKQTQAERAGLPGLGHQPPCDECQKERSASGEMASPPPPWRRSKRGRQPEIQSTWQYCPEKKCQYYGWPGLGNLTSNGHPNRSRWRQWHCRACGGYFMETRGTPLYRRTVAVEVVGRVLMTLAEGVSLQGTARLCQVEVETVALWLELAANHYAELAEYLSQQLELDQVQLDDLYVRLRAAQSNPKGRVCWIYNAFDPVSKFWLGYSVGERSLATVQHLVHLVSQRLVPGKIPLFLTDGEPSFESAILGHFGQWGEVTETGQTQRRWLPLPELEYVQVVKQRVKRRLVQVKQRLVSGNLDQIKAKLAAHGWSINTAFIERFNLTLRQHVPALGRRVLAYAQSQAGLSRQLALVYLYYNFSLPHAALRQPGKGRRQQERTPAMALGLTNRVWPLEELLLIRVPPWSQARVSMGG